MSDGPSGTHIPPSIACLLNRILDTGHVPQELGLAVITPLVKDPAGDTADPTNYRPIAVSSAMSKIVSACIHHRLSTWVERESLLPEEQAGFRPGRSIADHHLVMRTLIDQAVNSQQPLYVTFADVKGAYDATRQVTLLKENRIE